MTSHERAPPLWITEGVRAALAERGLEVPDHEAAHETCPLQVYNNRKPVRLDNRAVKDALLGASHGSDTLRAAERGAHTAAESKYCFAGKHTGCAQRAEKTARLPERFITCLRSGSYAEAAHAFEAMNARVTKIIGELRAAGATCVGADSAAGAPHLPACPVFSEAARAGSSPLQLRQHLPCALLALGMDNGAQTAHHSAGRRYVQIYGTHVVALPCPEITAHAHGHGGNHAHPACPFAGTAIDANASWTESEVQKHEVCAFVRMYTSRDSEEYNMEVRAMLAVAGLRFDMGWLLRMAGEDGIVFRFGGEWSVLSAGPYVSRKAPAGTTPVLRVTGPVNMCTSLLRVGHVGAFFKCAQSPSATVVKDAFMILATKLRAPDALHELIAAHGRAIEGLALFKYAGAAVRVLSTHGDGLLALMRLYVRAAETGHDEIKAAGADVPRALLESVVDSGLLQQALGVLRESSAYAVSLQAAATAVHMQPIAVARKVLRDFVARAGLLTGSREDIDTWTRRLVAGLVRCGDTDSLGHLLSARSASGADPHEPVFFVAKHGSAPVIGVRALAELAVKIAAYDGAVHVAMSVLAACPSATQAACEAAITANSRAVFEAAWAARGHAGAHVRAAEVLYYAVMFGRMYACMPAAHALPGTVAPDDVLLLRETLEMCVRANMLSVARAVLERFPQLRRTGLVGVYAKHATSAPLEAIIAAPAPETVARDAATATELSDLLCTLVRYGQFGVAYYWAKAAREGGRVLPTPDALCAALVRAGPEYEEPSGKNYSVKLVHMLARTTELNDATLKTVAGTVWKYDTYVPLSRLRFAGGARISSAQQIDAAVRVKARAPRMHSKQSAPSAVPLPESARVVGRLYASVVGDPDGAGTRVKPRASAAVVPTEPTPTEARYTCSRRLVHAALQRCFDNYDADTGIDFTAFRHSAPAVLVRTCALDTELYR